MVLRNVPILPQPQMAPAGVPSPLGFEEGGGSTHDHFSLAMCSVLPRYQLAESALTWDRWLAVGYPSGHQAADEKFPIDNRRLIALAL